MNNNSENNKERLRGFKKKSEILRQAHSDLASKYSRYIIESDIFNIFASGIIAFLALSDSRKILEPLQLILNHLGAKVDFEYTLAETLFAPALGILGLAIFLLSLISLICGWSDRALKHGEGVKLFTDLITDIRDIVDRSDATADNENPNENQVAEIKKSYILICSMLPTIPDRDFLKSKEKYLIKRKESEEMDRK